MSSLELKSAAPHIVLRPEIDLSAFPRIPDFAAETILEFLPDGTCGIEGHHGHWIASLHFDSLERFAKVLNEADKKRFPRFWIHARVTEAGGL